MARMRIREVEKEHAAAGGYFFSRDTMRFFNSRIESELYNGGWFVTSERFEDVFSDDVYPREYRVRWFDADSPINIDSVGDAYGSKADAVAAIRALQNGGE